MRTCPYCAQPVDDQATRCPHCQNDLGQPAAAAPRPVGPPVVAPPAGPSAGPRPVGPPMAAAPAVTPAPEGPSGYGPPAPPPVPGPARVVGEGALRFSHSGERYLLGYGSDFFGIWDRFVAGPAVLRFSRTDQGWAEAWGQFVAREPRSVAVPAVGTTAPGGAVATGAGAPVYRDGHGRAVTVMVLLAASGVVALVVAGVVFSLHGQLQRGQLGVLTAVHRAQSAIAFAWIVQVATIVTWCMWEFRARSNLDAFGATGFSISPAWGVGWWFIPIANLFMPYRAMNEVLRASSPTGGSIEWQREGTGPLLPLWWTALLCAWIISQGANSTISDSTASLLTPSGTVTSLAWITAGQVLIAVAAVFAILVVREVDRRQAERRRVAMGEAVPTAA